MRRLCALAILLAFTLTLAACGSGGAASAQDPPAGDADEEDVAIFDCGGLQAALPARYLDQLYVETDFPDAAESWKPLMTVYEKASYEAAMEEFGGGGGLLFGFLAMDQAAFEQYLCADDSGVDVFATDGERYYAYTFATDVQFLRSGLGGSNLLDHPDWKNWETLNEIGPAVREDFLTRNGLQSFSARDFASQLTAEGEDSVCVRYYPYFLKDGDTRIYYQLLLRQPARQGEGGIWAVESWMDKYGLQYLYFPDSGMPAAEYYAGLQEECGAGQHPELLTAFGAAAAFVTDYFGRETGEGSFEEAPGIDYTYPEMNGRLQQLALDVMAGRDADPAELLDCLTSATADNWGVLGRAMYGSDWFSPLMNAVANAAVGDGQQRRDEAVLSFLLATCDARTDFTTPLNDVLKRQREADPAAFEAALAAFPADAFIIEEGTGVISAGPAYYISGGTWYTDGDAG